MYILFKLLIWRESFLVNIIIIIIVSEHNIALLSLKQLLMKLIDKFGSIFLLCSYIECSYRNIKHPRELNWKCKKLHNSKNWSEWHHNFYVDARNLLLCCLEIIFVLNFPTWYSVRMTGSLIFVGKVRYNIISSPNFYFSIKKNPELQFFK